MSIPAWFWPPSGATARSVAVAAYGAGMAVADWLTPTLWPFATNSFGAGVVLASGTPGIADLATDASNGVWAIGWNGTLWHKPSASSATSGQMPSGQVYTGCTMVGTSAFVMSSSGIVYTTGGTQVGQWPTPAACFASSGTTMAALLPGSGVGTMTTAGVTGLIAFPAGIVNPTALIMASGLPTAIGGWQNAPSLSGAVAAAISPVNASVMAAVGSGRAIIWATPGPLSDVWSQASVLTGLANLNSLCWTADGFHVLATSPTSGVVQVLNYASGVLSLSQTVNVSGACSIAITDDLIHAVVGQSGQTQLASLTFTGAWVSGVAVTGIPDFYGNFPMLPYGASGAVVAYSSGASYLFYSSGGWSVINQVGLGWTPDTIALDAFSQVYVAGSGRVAMISASGLTAPALIASGTWSGGLPTSLVVQQGRIVIAVPNDSKTYLFGQSATNTLTQQGSAALAQGTSVGMALSETTLFSMGSGSTIMYGFSGTPFTLTQVQSGAIAQRPSSSWTTTALGLGNTPSALTYDASGNLNVATNQNNFWIIASGGTVQSSGILQSYSTQPQSVPVSVSSMIQFNGAVYLATSIPGVFGELGASVSTNLYNDNGVLALYDSTGWPMSSGAAAIPGNFWSNGGVVSIVSGSTPNPLASPVYFGAITSSSLLSMGGQNLPTGIAVTGTLQLWNNGGEVWIA